ncbi:rhomboid family intramembrane serine protease [Ferrimonas senticii]|uniref:rhomboid family intramembrane serine protease n=1 Tax=Ferrimonas senticii TaxID=394566 RepID=UPI00040846C3|nr:rhomboid family intramembrane serine protease [Ferrimonas senticii]
MDRISNALLPLKQGLQLSAMVVCLLWLIWLLDWSFDWSLYQYGIYPRQTFGLVGIVVAPLIHGSAEHLAANSTGVLVLGSALYFGYPHSRGRVLLLVWLAAGIGVWLAGRPSYHFGASGLTHGVFFFLLISSLLRRDLRSIGLMMVAFLLFGGMVYGVLPQDPGISFESHLFGAVGGVLAALWFARRDPQPTRKRYRYEQDDSDPTDGLWQQLPESEEAQRQYRHSRRERL